MSPVREGISSGVMRCSEQVVWVNSLCFHGAVCLADSINDTFYRCFQALKRQFVHFWVLGTNPNPPHEEPMTSEHASTPLLTTDRISQLTSTSAAIHQQSSSQKTSTAMSLTDPKVPDFNPAQSNPVTGWNIFWTVLSFTVACATHPINSGLGFPPEYRHVLHLTSINSAIDASLLLIAVIKQVGRARGHLFQACALVVAIRLERNRNPMLQERSLRIFLALVFTLQYSKLWGYHGIPLVFAWSTVSFGSWVLMELIYILGSFHHPPNGQLPRGRTLTMPITRTYFAARIYVCISANANGFGVPFHL